MKSLLVTFAIASVCSLSAFTTVAAEQRSPIRLAQTLRPFDRCVANCMERNCGRYGSEAQSCQRRVRGGCVRECQRR